eukprot:1844239-Amphidinium_carterae.1
MTSSCCRPNRWFYVIGLRTTTSNDVTVLLLRETRTAVLTLHARLAVFGTGVQHSLKRSSSQGDQRSSGPAMSAHCTLERRHSTHPLHVSCRIAAALLMRMRAAFAPASCS